MADPDPEVQIWPKLDPIKVGLRGKCPRCGKGRLFQGFLTLRKECESCGLSYAFADPADGPAFFVICFGCIPVLIFEVFVQVAYDPPYWVHALTTLPVMLLTCILPLRPLKGWLICTQFFHKAREGRLAAPWTPHVGGPTIEAVPHSW